MDLRIIVDVFVVVVIGGLASIVRAYVDAVLVSDFNAFGILGISEDLHHSGFLVMAAVLIVRPWACFGKAEAPARRTPGLTVNPWRPLTSNERLGGDRSTGAVAALPLVSGNCRPHGLARKFAIFVIFAASLHFLDARLGGLAFVRPRAAYFGLAIRRRLPLPRLAAF